MVRSRSRVGLLLSSFSCLFLAACGSKDHPDRIAPLDPGDLQVTWPTDGKAKQDLLLDPANALLFIDAADPKATPQQQYKIKTTDGRDVTADSKMAVRDKELGIFDGTKFFASGILPSGTSSATTLVAGGYQGALGFGVLSLVKLRITGEQKDAPIIFKKGAAASPNRVALKFGSGIGQIDVAVVMDTTGSMGGSIDNLKTNLTAVLFPKLTAAIPNVGIAVVDHKDYPVSPHGDKEDFPVKVLQPVTTEATVAAAAVAKMKASGGADLPEAQIAAMFHTLTGAGLSWTGGSVATHTSPAGMFGAVDFRAGSLPVVVLITDVDWHDAKSNPYVSDVNSPPTLEALKAAFLDKHARFVDITDKATGAKEAQANELSDATKSSVPPAAFGGKCGVGKCCTGVSGEARDPTGPGGSCRLNFLHEGGKGVSDSIATAIQGIKDGSIFDVSAVLSNDPKNPDGVDATKFVTAMGPLVDGDPKSGCKAHSAIDSDSDGKLDTFTAVSAGSDVCWEVTVANNSTIAAGDTVKVYIAYVSLIGNPGAVVLDRRAVAFIVPPNDLVAK